MSGLHGNTRRMLGAGKALYSSDVKFGYDKKPHKFLYQVGDQKMTFADVRALVPTTISDATLHYRLQIGFATNVEQLSRPVVESQKNSAIAMAKSLGREARSAYRASVLRSDKRAYYRRKAAEHKQL